MKLNLLNLTNFNFQTSQFSCGYFLSCTPLIVWSLVCTQKNLVDTPQKSSYLGRVACSGSERVLSEHLWRTTNMRFDFVVRVPRRVVSFPNRLYKMKILSFSEMNHEQCNKSVHWDGHVVLFQVQGDFPRTLTTKMNGESKISIL